MHWRASSLVPGLLAAAVALGASVAHAGSEPADPSPTPGSEQRQDAPDATDLDVRIMCQELEIGLPAGYGAPEDVPGFDDAEFHRLTAVAALAVAAGLGDAGYEAIGEAGDTLFAAWSRMRVDVLDDAMATLRDECAALDDAPDDTSAGETAMTATGFDVHAACLLVDGLPTPFTFPDDVPGIDDPLLWRIQAIAGLGQAAALADDAHRALGEAARAFDQARLRLDADDFVTALDELREECASAGGGTGDTRSADS